VRSRRIYFEAAMSFLCLFSNQAPEYRVVILLGLDNYIALMSMSYIDLPARLMRSPRECVMMSVELSYIYFAVRAPER
jgi:hypothetical protein